MQSTLPQQTIVRRATAADAAAISALLRRAFIEFEPRYTPEAFAATVLDEAAVVARMNEGPLWVAESASAIIGTIGSTIGSTVGGTIGAKLAGDTVWLKGMAADPSAQGLGVGRQLLETAEAFAASQQASRIELYTTAFLARAIGLYRSSGFSFTGEAISPHGTELLHMSKLLHRP